MSNALMTQLQQYQPILPEQQYQAWAIVPRERLLDVYAKGCTYVARANLDRSDTAQSMLWAEKAIAVAPWAEDGYQMLMRAQARVGDHTLALHSYTACVVALQREEGVPPSQLTEWLASCLRAGEAI